jgi:hypothetical protein
MDNPHLAACPSCGHAEALRRALNSTRWEICGIQRLGGTAMLQFTHAVCQRSYSVELEHARAEVPRLAAHLRAFFLEAAFAAGALAFVLTTEMYDARRAAETGDSQRPSVPQRAALIERSREALLDQLRHLTDDEVPHDELRAAARLLDALLRSRIATPHEIDDFAVSLKRWTEELTP